MNFNEALNKYIKLIGCTGKKLADETLIPQPIISDYRNGNRTPKYNSTQFKNLVKGLSILAKQNNIVDINEDSIQKDLEQYLTKNDIDFEIFRNNFNTLINVFKINVADLAKYIGFDSSYISKIKSGVRKPLNISDFADAITKYTTNNYLNTSPDTLKVLINCNDEEINNKDLINEKLYLWLTNNTLLNKDDYKIDDFIKKLDDFDLNDYIKAIKFDKLFVPTFPKIKTKAKNYYAFQGYKDAQIEILKLSAFYKNKDAIFWYSNMPIISASKDIKFVKKYMMYIAFILKKGINLNIIHDLNRPFKEIMLGLEGWIPLYMTGQIHPYYFKKNLNSLYSNIECTSSTAILHGQCINGKIETGKFLVSTKKEDINYYQQNSKLLLEKASPFIDIYTLENKEQFLKTFNNSSLKNNRRNILLNLPFYTLTSELLDTILTNNKVPLKDCKKIHSFLNEEKNKMHDILASSIVTDEISIIKENEFNNVKCTLDLSKYFYNKEIKYNYTEYKKHLKLTKLYQKENKNYYFKINNKNIFKNINIYIIENKQVIISKINKPITHFVIYHATLINAIQNFKVPINEINN